MSRYLVQVPRDSLSESRKAAIADAIASAHRAITGANAHTVQIAISEIDAGCFFSGGCVIECPCSRTSFGEPGLSASHQRPRLERDKISRDDILAHAFAQCRSNTGAPGADGQDFALISAASTSRSTASQPSDTRTLVQEELPCSRSSSNSTRAPPSGTPISTPPRC